MRFKTSILPRVRSLLAAAAPVVTACAIAAGSVGFVVPAHAAPAVDLVSPPSIGGVNGTGFVVGYRFLANVDLLVTALGAYDYKADGLQSRADIGLYTLGGDLLASATVPTGTSGSVLEGFFRYVDINAVTLAAGTEYVLGAYSEDPFGFFNQNYGGVVLDVNPAITLLRNRDEPRVTALEFPDREPTNAHLGSFGPNMQITQVAEVPEPGSLALVLAGFSAMALLARRRVS